MAKKKTVHKTDLIKQLAQVEGISLKDSHSIVNSFIELIKANLKKGKDVNIQRFGHLAPKKMKARTGRNPQTGEKIKIPARTVISMHLSQEVRDMLREEK